MTNSSCLPADNTVVVHLSPGQAADLHVFFVKFAGIDKNMA